MREPKLSPRAEPVQKLGNNAGITTKGCIGGFALFALKPTVEISAYRFIAEDGTVRNLINIGNNLSCLPVGEQPHPTQPCGVRIPICDFLGVAFVGFFRGALTSAAIWTDETSEPIARAGESAETCRNSQRLLSTFERVQAYVSVRFLYEIDTHTRPARFLGVRVPSPALMSDKSAV